MRLRVRVKGGTPLGERLWAGAPGYKVTVPPAVDVKSIRKQLKMTEAAFSDTFGLSLDAIKHWEDGCRTPEVPARAYLTILQHNPAAVLEALRQKALLGCPTSGF